MHHADIVLCVLGSLRSTIHATASDNHPIHPVCVQVETAAVQMLLLPHVLLSITPSFTLLGTNHTTQPGTQNYVRICLFYTLTGTNLWGFLETPGKNSLLLHGVRQTMLLLEILLLHGLLETL